MIGWVRAVSVCAALALGLVSAEAADKAFKRDDLADSAIRLEAQIKTEAGVVNKGVAALKTDTDAAFKRNDLRGAMLLLGQTAAVAPQDSATWLRLDIGHDERADPKWLLPMLCRAGDLSRRDIGMIRIMGDHTFVQIHADATERFLAAIGPERALEDKCGVDVLPGQPEGMEEALARQGTRADRKPGPGKKPYEKKSFDKKPYDKKPHRKGGDFEGERPARPAAAKPWDKKGAEGKPAAKYGKPGAKPGAKPFGKPGAKPAGKSGAKPGAKPWEKKGR